MTPGPSATSVVPGGHDCDGSTADQGRLARAVARLRPSSPGAGEHRRILATLMRAALRVSRVETAALVAMVLVHAVVALALILATGALVSAIAAGRSPWAALTAVGAALALEGIALPMLAPALESLAHRLDRLSRETVMLASARPHTVAHLETAETADRVELAASLGATTPPLTNALEALVAIASTRLVALGSGAILLSYRWWAPLAIAAAWLLSHGWYRRDVASLVSSLERSTTSFRRGQYFGELALDGAASKEVRVFGLTPWILRGFDHHWWGGLREAWSERRRHRWAAVRSGVLVLAAHAVVLGLLARSAVRGEIEVGALAVFAQAVLAMSGLAWDADDAYLVTTGASPLVHSLELETTLLDEGQELSGGRSPGTSPAREVRFEGVSFTYPGSERPVLRGVDLTIEAGRSLAIVGDNGSGKTTLVKLLCRFYDPDEGAVLVDGCNLREIEPESWHRRIAAVFQDFARYPLPAHENVVFGRPERADDRDGRSAVAERAGVREVIEALPLGWETILSRAYAGGAELSGGQWQRLALARALFAVEGGARLLVLDEPTASLDVRAEADFYHRFLRLTSGLTTIVVSHRFSTVRRADRIVVLEQGRIVEEGGHDELVARGGRYARMFALQAEHYREPAGA